MAVLRRWRTEPPTNDWFGEADLRSHCRKAQRKADRRLLVAVRSDDETALHSARKAAKRARYAGELLGAVRPKGRRKAKGYKRLQSVLGDHQDPVVAMDMLRRLAAGTSEAQDQNGFTFGLLHAHEQRIAEETRSKAAKLVKKGCK
jgi:CHAD domain-containing protein